jgi:hypothetical protein
VGPGALAAGAATAGLGQPAGAPDVGAAEPAGGGPRSTPLGGSWLNLAESGQRLLVQRALAGEPPRTREAVMGWPGAAVAGWNADPTPFAWGGKRADRRRRQRARRHALARSGGYTRRPLPRLRRPPTSFPSQMATPLATDPLAPDRSPRSGALAWAITRLRPSRSGRNRALIVNDPRIESSS